MKKALIAGAMYFAVAFGAGFALGTIRTLALEPTYGEFAAVLIELPFILAASWVACGWALRRFLVSNAASARAVMGGAAFSLLIAAEFALAALFGETPNEIAAAWRTRAGVLGLSGQLAFALFPLIRRRA